MKIGTYIYIIISVTIPCIAIRILTTLHTIAKEILAWLSSIYLTNTYRGTYRVVRSLIILTITREAIIICITELSSTNNSHTRNISYFRITLLLRTDVYIIICVTEIISTH
jgi:hypothetical protein